LQDQAEKAKALPLNSQIEKHGPINPAPSFAPNKNKAKIDVKKAEAKLNALERERQKYQLAIEKLREERNARAKRIAEKSNMLQEMRDQRRRRECELNLKADDKHNRIRMKEMNIKQQKSDAVMQKVRADPKYRQDVENLKQVQAEKEKWQREVGRLQSQIDALQKKSEPIKGAIISNYSLSSNAILTPRKQPTIQSESHSNNNLQNPPDQKPLTDKERVLLEKEKKRKEEEEIYIKRLREERIKVYQEKLNAQQLNALQYQPSFYQPSARNLPAYQVPSSQQNPQKIVPKKYDNEKKEEDEEEYLLNELQDGLLHATKKIENLRKSIAAAQARGAMIEDDSESEYEELDEDNDEQESEEEDDRNDNVRIGRLADRAKFLRNQCNKVFGQDLFEKIYNHIKLMNDRNMVHDENDQKRYKRLISVLGLNNVKLVDYCHLIDELLFVEGTMS
jgi:myosin heavy subunit